MSKENIIELHCHVLPQMDDGSRSVEMSLQMLQKMARDGITTVCATSHYYADQNDIETFCERREESLEALYEAMPEGLPRILPGAEVAYFTQMSDRDDIERLCIEGTRTMMLEMPFCDWSDMQVEEVYAMVLDLKYWVVLVHPERFCYSDGNIRRLERLLKLPIGVQVNAETLIHWRTRKFALQLLQAARLPLVGSDCHNMKRRPPNLAKARRVIRRKLGADFLARMDRAAAMLIEPQYPHQPPELRDE